MEKELTLDEKNKIIQRLFEDLIESVPRLQKPESRAKVEKAFLFAQEAHKNQFRQTGSKLPYISHPIAVAKIVGNEMGFGSTTVAAALLHDVVEDTKYTVANIQKIFGEEIAFIVDGLTKITNRYDPNRKEQAATFQKLILKMSEDKRVAFIKIADRLHNLRTMDKMRINSKMIKTAEALSVYAPLAFQLGLFNIRKEIENISFKLREPEEYHYYEKIVNQYNKSLQKATKEISKAVSQALEDSDIETSIVPVQKSLHRLRKDMKEKKLTFAQVKNFQSERIVFKTKAGINSEEECFKVYCKVSRVFKMRPESLRDWVTKPRLNGFQGLIFDILHEGYWKELQIMSEEMHQIAQKGYAENHDNPHIDNITKWASDAEKSIQDSNLTDGEIVDMAIIDHTEIHVFTPKGEVKSLPKGSTVLDFAFKIHSNIGLTFMSAEVNRKPVEIDYILQNGDMVKIINSENIKPKREWIDILTSAGSKAHVKSFFSKQRIDKSENGKRIFDEYIKKFQLKANDINKIVDFFGAKTVEDLRYKIGKEYILPEDFDKNIKEKSDLLSFLKLKAEKKKNLSIPGPREPFTIRSLEEISLSECCKAVPGDSCIIYISDSKEMYIHKRQCETAKKLNAAHGKQTRAVIWDIKTNEQVVARIQVEGRDRQGVLADMIKVIYEDLDANMRALNILSAGNTFSGSIEIYVTNKKMLDAIIKQIKNIQGVFEIYRL